MSDSNEINFVALRNTPIFVLDVLGQVNYPRVGQEFGYPVVRRFIECPEEAARDAWHRCGLSEKQSWAAAAKISVWQNGLCIEESWHDMGVDAQSVLIAAAKLACEQFVFYMGSHTAIADFLAVYDQVGDQNWRLLTCASETFAPVKLASMGAPVPAFGAGE